MAFILGVLAVLLIIWKIYVIIRMILHPMFWLGLLYNALLWGGFIYVMNHSYEIQMGDKLLIAIGVAAALFFFTSRTFRRPYVVAFCIVTLGLGAMMLADSYFADDMEMADQYEDPGVHHVEDHEVSGYVRADGTPVSGYHRGGTDGYLRSNPDDILDNNLK